MYRLLRQVLVVSTMVPALGLTTALGQTPDSPRYLTIDDGFQIQRVRDPQFSPEGEWIAYTVTQTDLKEEKSETAVWMIPAEGGEPIRMTGKGSSASRPRWSPDGKYLSFQASRGEGKTQVWGLNRKGGEAQQLTDVKQGIGSYEWSPDGKRLVLVVKDPEPGEEEDKSDEKKDKPKPHVIDRLQFKRDYSGYLDRRRNHLYVFDLDDRKLRQITSGDYDDSQPEWSPDGKSIVFVSNRTQEPDGNDNSDLWLVSADNSDQGKTLLQLTKNPGSDSQPAWSPDGKWVCYVTVVRPEILWYATSHLAMVPSGGGESRLLNETLDRNVSAPEFAPDGKIYFLLEDSAERHLARVNADGTGLERPVAGPMRTSSYSLGPNSEVAVLVSRPDLPGEIFRKREGRLDQISHVNDELMSKLRLATVENVQFPSKDGTQIEGFIFKPPDFNDKLTYPTLLRIHGGPVSQYDFGFNFEAQLFAANGYVVVLTNPRGSSGYGEEFSLGIYRSWGRKDFEDVMAGVDYAIQQGYADPDRLGVG
ncbi:MAG: prolyl oligopeptidase family serine peptidase, partial [Fidelibacterota bacterium]